MSVDALGWCEPWMVQHDARTQLVNITLWVEPPGTPNRAGRQMICTALQDWPPYVVELIHEQMTSGILGTA